MGRLLSVKGSVHVDRPQAGGYNTFEIALASGLARGNEPPNQILDSYDPAKMFLSVQDSSKSESGSAQLLHNPISGLILSGGYDAPDIIV